MLPQNNRRRGGGKGAASPSAGQKSVPFGQLSEGAIGSSGNFYDCSPEFFYLSYLKGIIRKIFRGARPPDCYLSFRLHSNKIL